MEFDIGGDSSSYVDKNITINRARNLLQEKPRLKLFLTVIKSRKRANGVPEKPKKY